MIHEYENSFVDGCAAVGIWLFSCQFFTTALVNQHGAAPPARRRGIATLFNFATYAARKPYVNGALTLP
jgi:hypothetical protein